MLTARSVGGGSLARTYYKFSSYEATPPTIPEIEILNEEEMSFYYMEFMEPIPNEEIDGVIPRENILSVVFDSDDDDDDENYVD